MAISATKTLGELRTDVLDRLRDPTAIRYSQTRILAAMVTALTTLAKEDLYFFRWDVFVPTQNQSVFTLAGPPQKIDEVTWDGKGLTVADEATLRRFVGQDWRSETGDPRYFYMETRQRLRLVPAPDVAGDALTYGSVTTRTEAVWKGTEAHRLFGTIRVSNGAYVLWEPGDGQVSNDMTAQNLVRVKYRYMPIGLHDDTPADPEIHEALRAFSLWRELSVSRRAEDQAMAPRHKEDWELEKMRLGNTVGLDEMPGAIDLLGACG